MTSQDGMELISQIVQIYANYDFRTEVLVASVRHPLHVVQAAMLGADVATVPAKVLHQLMHHPLTDKGIEGSSPTGRSCRRRARSDATLDPGPAAARSCRPGAGAGPLGRRTRRFPCAAMCRPTTLPSSRRARCRQRPRRCRRRQRHSPAADSVQDVDASRRTAIVRAAERVAPAVVSVNVIRRETLPAAQPVGELLHAAGVSRDVPGLGSGFIIDAQGLVLTNEHVVRGATELVVTLRDGRDFEADLVGSDEVTDLALLRLRNVTGSLPVAPLGSSANLIIGEWVVAIGNPFGFMLANAEATVTAGVVSGVNRNIIPRAAARAAAGTST
jgi:hypothetical protein